ncbi:hypothetical protein, partial [Thiolapillus sp.]
MFSLWRKARRENSAASRLLGTTSLRFALHGWQRSSRSAIAGFHPHRTGRADFPHPALPSRSPGLSGSQLSGR